MFTLPNPFSTQQLEVIFQKCKSDHTTSCLSPSAAFPYTWNEVRPPCSDLQGPASFPSCLSLQPCLVPSCWLCCSHSLSRFHKGVLFLSRKSWPVLCMGILLLALCVTDFFWFLRSRVLLHLLREGFCGLSLAWPLPLPISPSQLPAHGLRSTVCPL